jgi:HlyD family secretion protein
MKKRWIAVAVGIGVLGLSAAFLKRGPKELPYKLVSVTRGRVIEKAVATGTLKPEREISVKSKISGLVRKRFHEIGDVVRAGDPLFEILPDPTPLELTEARRESEIANNVFEQTRKNHDRSKSLHTQGVLSARDLDQADKDVQEAELRLKLAQERLALVEKGRVKIGETNVESIIRAPVTGTVLELLVNEGDPVVPLSLSQPGTPLATLADMSTLMFKGTVDEIDVGKLKEGLPARIRVGALPDAQVDGTIAKIAPKSKVQDGATFFDVEVDLKPAQGVVLRAGYSATADIVVREKENTLLLPERLVTFDKGKASVEVPSGKPDATPAPREITVGLSDGLNIEIVSGLGENDQVVERPPKKIE